MTEESRRVRDREVPADAAQLVSNTEEGATTRNPSGLYRLQEAREETLPGDGRNAALLPHRRLLTSTFGT